MVNDKTDASVMKKNFSSGGFIIFGEYPKSVKTNERNKKLNNVSLSN